MTRTCAIKARRGGTACECVDYISGIYPKLPDSDPSYYPYILEYRVACETTLVSIVQNRDSMSVELNLNLKQKSF